jgi:spermidine dehydrogenase
MTDELRKQSHDSALDMDHDISRRDFMNATLLASGGALLSGLTPHQLLAQMGKDNWTGYGGVGDYADSHGNTFEVMTAGHQIRDHVFADPPHQAEDTGEVLDYVIAGGGLSSLASALYFQQKAPQANCLVLENHPIFGGEANEFIVDGHRLMAPQGSDHFDTPQPGSPMDSFYASIGVDATKFEYQAWKSSSQPGFFFGKDGQPAPREILRRAPFGRIAFANTDLSGDPGHTTAIAEGQRAANQLLDRI